MVAFDLPLVHLGDHFGQCLEIAVCHVAKSLGRGRPHVPLLSQIVVHQRWHDGHEFDLCAQLPQEFPDTTRAVARDSVQPDIDRIASIGEGRATPTEDGFSLQKDGMIPLLGEKAGHAKSADPSPDDNDIVLFHLPPSYSLWPRGFRMLPISTTAIKKPCSPGLVTDQ